jgi:hypothetical protein
VADAANKKAPAPAPAASSESAKVSVPEDQKIALEVEARFKDGKYDEAIDEGLKLLATTKDPDAKLTASKAVAESMRKKGDWSRAAGAYSRLRECYAKDSADWYLNDAMTEIMKASPKGIYSPGVSAPGGSDPAPKTLSDDGVLKESLSRLANIRMKALQGRETSLRSSNTPQRVVASLKPTSDDAKRIMGLTDNVSSTVPHEIGTVAGTRLKDLGATNIAGLKNKYQTQVRPVANRPWDITNVQKNDFANTAAQCKEMAEAEKTFQECLDTLTGSSDWPEGRKLAEDSRERAKNYEQLSTQFTVRDYPLYYIY